MMRRNAKLNNYIKEIASKNDIPYAILYGIINIETSYRKLYFRIAEYFCTICSYLTLKLFKIPMKNYTVGVCQVGIAMILSSQDRNIYIHNKYINRIEKGDFLKIIKSFFKRNNIEVCASFLKTIYLDEIMKHSNMKIVVRRIGEKYNGHLSYGLMLERQYFKILKENNSALNFKIN